MNTEISAKRIVAHLKGLKRWESENFGNVWVVWNFNDDDLKDIFELKWWEIDGFLKNWKEQNKGFRLEFIN